jgi:hypothetical protein
MHAGLALMVVGFAVILLPWLAWGGGTEYLRQYWAGSVAPRMSGGQWTDHLMPLKELLTGYWPWLPLYIWGLRTLPKGPPRQRVPRIFLPPAAPALISLIVLAGFMVPRIFLGHYLVLFYPFAALVAAGPAAAFTRPRADRWTTGLLTLAVVYTALVAALPLHTKGKDYADPARNVLRRATQECDRRVKRVAISTSIADIWFGLALGSWITDWEPRSMNPYITPAKDPSEVLVARVGEPLAEGWEATALREGSVRLFARKGSYVCPNSF